MLTLNRQKPASCNKSVNILQHTCYNKPIPRCVRMGYGQIVDDRSVASSQQTCCKLIVKISTILNFLAVYEVKRVAEKVLFFRTGNDHDRGMIMTEE